jgi:hypothetical protein
VIAEYSLLSPVYDVADVVARLVVLGISALHLWAAVLVVRVCRRYLRRTDPRGVGSDPARTSEQVAATGAPVAGASTRGVPSPGAVFSPGTWAGGGVGVVVPALVVGAVGLVLTVLSVL